MGPAQWEWIATARLLSRQRPSVGAVEQVIDGLLSGADEAMVNAFTTGFRVTQVQTAIGKVLPDSAAVAAALESAQVVALGILVREQMDPAQFAPPQGLFLVGYAVARMSGELFRQPDPQLGFLIFGTTMGQLLSIPFLIAGILIIAWGLRAPVPARP